METRELEHLVEEALDAFWEVIGERFPEAKYGDLSPERSIRLDVAAEAAVKEWISNNVPQAEHGEPT